jgi:hypothetical protein
VGVRRVLTPISRRPRRGHLLCSPADSNPQPSDSKECDSSGSRSRDADTFDLSLNEYLPTLSLDDLGIVRSIRNYL